MKMMAVSEVRNDLASTLKAANEDLIIVTRNGRPVAAIKGISGTASIDDGELEDLLLERSERFWLMIARDRRGKPIALETLRKQVAAQQPSGARKTVSRLRRRAR